MTKLNPDKLMVTFLPGASQQNPVIPRRYTLTHSDVTGELFLSIGPDYVYKNIGPLRDEVLAEWQYLTGQFYLSVYVYVGSQADSFNPALRYKIFQRELPLALSAIIYGDKEFFAVHPELAFAPIWIYFASANPYYNRLEFWGTASQY